MCLQRSRCSKKPVLAIEIDGAVPLGRLEPRTCDCDRSADSATCGRDRGYGRRRDCIADRVVAQQSIDRDLTARTLAGTKAGAVDYLRAHGTTRWHKTRDNRIRHREQLITELLVPE